MQPGASAASVQPPALPPALVEFTPIRPWLLRVFLRHLWELQILLLGVDLWFFTVSRTPPFKTVLIVSPHVFLAVAAVLAHRLFQRLPGMLRRLWERGVIIERDDRGPGGKTSPKRRWRIAQETGKEAQFNEFIRRLDGRMNAPWAPVLPGLTFVTLFYLFYPAAGFPRGFPFAGHQIWKPIIGVDLVFQAVLVFLLGYIAWRLVVLAWEIGRLAGDFDFRFRLQHPDKSAGLGPLGDICFSIAVIWLVIAIYPVAWMILLLQQPTRLADPGVLGLGHLFPTTDVIVQSLKEAREQLASLQQDPTVSKLQVHQQTLEISELTKRLVEVAHGPLFWLSWYVISVVAVTLLFSVGTFFIPLYFVHRGMVRQHPGLLSSLDRLANVADGLALRARDEALLQGTDPDPPAPLPPSPGPGWFASVKAVLRKLFGCPPPAAEVAAPTTPSDRLDDLNKRLKAVQDAHAANQLVPGWPFDVKVLAKFVGAVAVPLGAVLTWLPALADKFIST